MSIPGWYPDPAGQPNRFRYWFGQQWSEVTTDNPYLPPPPPPGAVPPDQPEQLEQPEQPARPEQEQPEQPEQPEQEQPAPAWGIGDGWTPMSDAPADGDGATGKGSLIAVIVAVLALLLVGGGVGGWLLTREGDDGDRSAPSRSGETSEEPTEGEAAPQASCPPGDPTGPNRIRAGRVVGGGLSFAVPRGYRPAAPGNKLGFRWLSDLSGVERVTESVPELNYGWVSMLVAGAVEKGDGSATPEQAARTLAGCMASSPDMYRSHLSDRQLSSEATRVDGRDAWEVRHEVRVDDEVVRAEGDHVVVIAVDLGDEEERYAVFVGFVPLGDEELGERLDQAVRTLRVE